MRVAKMQALAYSVRLDCKPLQSSPLTKYRLRSTVHVGIQYNFATQAGDCCCGSTARAEELLPHGAHALLEVDTASEIDHFVIP